MTAQAGIEIQTEPFTIIRTFDAPRDLVWQAFADGERLGQWWGPKGCEITVRQFDFRPGGLFVYGMTWPGAPIMWARFEYREISEPERIVFVNSFSDEAGNIARAPFFDGRWPLQVLTVVTLAEQDGKTTITLHAGPIHATEIEQQTFLSNFESMQGGYGGTFDKLDDHLTAVQAGA
jgi:uncharacterized protein YndB with AHSA1/START domain